jgi:hypothetical protein
MATPVMITNIGWGEHLEQRAGLQWLIFRTGTYLFFAAVNACFLPIIYIFYPETKDRSLEEAAKQLPFLSNAEIDAKAREYGFASDEEFGHSHSLDNEKAETYSRSSSHAGKKEDSQMV